MQLLRDPDIDPAPLEGRKIAIIGYGNQGRAQALNLHDGGFEVVIGLRENSPSIEKVEADGLRHAAPDAAVDGAALSMMLVPDEVMTSAYGMIASALPQGSALGFSHGLAVHFGFIDPRDDLDVVMLAPKGPGTALRSLYREGKGMPGLWAVERDVTGKAAAIVQAYGKAIGCARSGLIASTFAEECEADLFNEQAVVWGAVPAILEAGFETLVEAGYSEELAYFECVSELKLLADLIEARGIAGMREAISNTAELGAVLGGPRMVGEEEKAKMRAILADVRAGKFAEQLKGEEAEGYPLLRSARKEARSAKIEAVRQALDRLK
ncbi:ketol-acid reductoisomerase [Sphingomicrobium lutaoense]|uniref:Ketol-acid reductoisomerase n=1 Tax=Sphingomicrobium lutaoense TaxID=515949 RepID=A0A839YWY6_9SPHN|nr:ketol-acid reductoisomerase [Sphingomicrobium lutaoense]MBB3763546.1 ketol-acid reductoisomerase [Sphingomicrobium lutaoense]